MLTNASYIALFRESPAELLSDRKLIERNAKGLRDSEAEYQNAAAGLTKLIELIHSDERGY